MQHQRHLDPSRIAPETAIEMATINGAKALGLYDRIGSLETGKAADIAIFDLRKPHIGTVHRPISSLVCAARGSDVAAVMVNGKIVFRDGEFAGKSDYAQTINRAEEIGRAVVAKAGLDNRLSPHWRLSGNEVETEPV